jgi:hypothetical protein
MNLAGTIVAALIFSMAPIVEPGSLRLAVDLVDGSRVIGVPSKKVIRVRADFAELTIPFSHIDFVTWKSDHENVTVRFQNGDVLSGGIVPEEINLKTLFGPVTISMDYIKTVETLPPELQSGPPLHDGLILYFPFDEQPENAVIVNEAQDKHHGKLVGARWTNEGRRGGAFTFSQSDDRIEIPDDPALHLKQVTLCAWILPEDERHSTWRGIITKSTSGNWSTGFGLARYNGTPDVHFYVNYYSGETTSKQVLDNQWSHLAASYDGQKMVLYLNGTRVDEEIPKSYGGPIRHGPQPLLIGTAPTGYNWIGKIDEVMIFDRVLSDREIERIYKRTQ